MARSAVIVKSNPHGLVLNLDPQLPFEELCQAVADKFRNSAAFFQRASLALAFRGRALTEEEESRLVDAVVQSSGIHVVCIVDESEETAGHFRQAVTRAQELHSEEDARFYRGTLRSGQVLETDTGVVVIGDVNPGAQIVSKGSIVILGCCMGSIHAGSSGNARCFAAALTMKPMQVRIADKTARSAIVKKTDTGEYPIDPRIVYIRDDHLQIKPITNETLSEYLGERE